MNRAKRTPKQDPVEPQPEGRRPITDRLTCALVGAAVLLGLVVAALAVDVWFARREAQSETVDAQATAPAIVATALAARSTSLAVEAFPNTSCSGAP